MSHVVKRMSLPVQEMTLEEVEDALSMRDDERYIHLGTDLDGVGDMNTLLVALGALKHDVLTLRDQGWVLVGPVNGGVIHMTTPEAIARQRALKARREELIRGDELPGESSLPLF